MAGAPKGNTNSKKSNHLWADTIRRACLQSDGERLRRIAEKLLDQAEEGNINAIKEIGDRLDGKAAQVLTNPDGEDLFATFGKVVREIVRPNDKDA